jgi:AGCS family alanine or glycine:cation symporter
MFIVQVASPFLWSWPLPLLLAGAGFYLGSRYGWPQFRLRYRWRQTFGAKSARLGGVTPLQSLCTSLSATIGTGNIVGVAIAVTAGGPGAVFWMWVSALLGMGTIYAENVLGVRYRRKFGGGPMYYLRDGLGGRVGRVLAGIYAGAVLASALGMGSMVQAGAIASAADALCGMPSLGTAVLLAALTGFAVAGGLKRVARLSEKLLPIMAGLYILGSFVLLALHAAALPDALASIVRDAFSMRSFSGGLAGSVISWGFRRGIFSNEAGLGTSTMVLSAADDVTETAAGSWGVVQVLADTLIVCTCTALCVLVTGAPNTAAAFASVFGPAGEAFVSVCLLLFALTTVLGCSVYGERAVGYLFGRGTGLYRAAYTAAVFVGSLADVWLAWAMADAVNAVLALSNLAGVLLLTKKETGATARLFK